MTPVQLAFVGVFRVSSPAVSFCWSIFDLQGWRAPSHEVEDVLDNVALRPVLKHGPRSEAYMRVEGWKNLKAQ